MKRETKETIKDVANTADSLISIISIIVGLFVVIGVSIFMFFLLKALQEWDPMIYIIKNTFR